MLQRLTLPLTIPNYIEVWQFDFDFRIPLQNADWVLLNESERAYAMRFHVRDDQVRSIATRAVLRRLLGEKTLVSPKQLRFVTNESGKPGLQGNNRIKFNVSHSGAYALIALSTSSEVGIDIERHNYQLDTIRLSQLVFTPVEQQLGLKVTRRFTEQWVLKESVLKALGVGITNHLQAVSIVPDNVDGEYSVIHTNPAWQKIKAWLIDSPTGYASAIAVVL